VGVDNESVAATADAGVLRPLSVERLLIYWWISWMRDQEQRYPERNRTAIPRRAGARSHSRSRATFFLNDRIIKNKEDEGRIVLLSHISAFADFYVGNWRTSPLCMGFAFERAP
jgi:hypothetical protein